MRRLPPVPLTLPVLQVTPILPPVLSMLPAPLIYLQPTLPPSHWQVDRWLVSIPEKALTLDATRRLECVVHVVGRLHSMGLQRDVWVCSP